jgi:site-specific recombinase XerC
MLEINQSVLSIRLQRTDSQIYFLGNDESYFSTTMNPTFSTTMEMSSKCIKFAKSLQRLPDAILATPCAYQLHVRVMVISAHSVGNDRKLGSRLGNWLTADEASALSQLPDDETLTGKRNRAILATLLGCGLRRRELAELALESLQRREERWAIVDLVGKGRHIRTVPVSNWVKKRSMSG